VIEAAPGEEVTLETRDANDLQITVEEVLAEYPYLEREDLLQALRYAAWRA